MKAQEIFDHIWEIAPNPPFCDENIIEYGEGSTEVKAVGVAWWITSDMMDEFGRRGINVGITHERVIYDIPETYPWGKPPKTFDLVANTRVRDLVQQHGITIHRFHGNIDLCDWGMPYALFEVLGWSQYPIDWSRGVPVVDHPPVTLRELIDELKAKLRLPFARYDGDLDRVVRRVSVPWGGMCQWWTGAACAAPIGCDVVVGGDAIDGVVRFAREQGWAVIDAFHHSTELPAMEVLARRVREKFPSVPVYYFENTMPWAAR